METTNNPMVSEESRMWKNLFYALAVATLAVVWVTGVEVRQAPPEPNCTLDPELCNKK